MTIICQQNSFITSFCNSTHNFYQQRDVGLNSLIPFSCVSQSKVKSILFVFNKFILKKKTNKQKNRNKLWCSHTLKNANTLVDKISKTHTQPLGWHQKLFVNTCTHFCTFLIATHFSAQNDSNSDNTTHTQWGTERSMELYERLGCY
jgi:hypothetical protein